MRNRIFNYLYKAGILNFFKTKKGESPILCFHRVHPDYDPITQPISPREFEELLVGLNKHFTFLPLEQLVDSDINHKNPCFITFDDALLDFYEYAFPILQKLKIPTTLFVPTASIEKKEELYNYELARLFFFAKRQDKSIRLPGLEPRKTMDLAYYLGLVSVCAKSHNRDELLSIIKGQLDFHKDSCICQPMTWKQLAYAKDEGINIGSHFHNHIWLNSRIESEIKEDLNDSLKLIKHHLNMEVKMVAYPMGVANDIVQKVVNESGLLGFSTQGVPFNSEIDHIAYLPRFNVTDRTYKELLFRVGGFHRKIKL